MWTSPQPLHRHRLIPRITSYSAYQSQTPKRRAIVGVAPARGWSLCCVCLRCFSISTSIRQRQLLTVALRHNEPSTARHLFIVSVWRQQRLSRICIHLRHRKNAIMQTCVRRGAIPAVTMAVAKRAALEVTGKLYKKASFLMTKMKKNSSGSNTPVSEELVRYFLGSF